MAIILTIDAIEPGGGEARYFMTGSAPPLFPVLIDTANLSQGTDQTLAGTYGQAFQRGASLFVVLWSQSVRKTYMMKSTDSGATWTVLDDANGPDAHFVPAHHYDGTTVWVVYQTDSLSFGPKQFQTFDFGTETWSAAFGTNSQPNLSQPNFVYHRSNGTIFVLTKAGMFDPDRTTSTLLAVSYDVATDTWGTPFDPGAGFTALAGFSATLTAVLFVSNYMNSDDTIGLFINITSFHNSPVIWNNRCFFQQILDDDSLGAFFDFPGQTSSTQDLLRPTQGPPFGAPVLVQDQIVLPVTRAIGPSNPGNAYPTIYVGTPISNPTWTELTSADGIDAGINAGDSTLLPNSAAGGAFDGKQITFVWIVPNAAGDTSFARLRQAQTSNLADPTMGWANADLFDYTVDPTPPGFTSPSGGQFLALPSLFGISVSSAPNTVRIPRMIRLLT